MKSVFRPVKEDYDENHPGAELLFWRSIIFFILFALAIIPLGLGLDNITLVKKAGLLLSSLILLVSVLYHVCLLLYFLTLRYEITDDSLVIRIAFLRKKIILSDIKSIRNISHRSLFEIRKKNSLSYFRESPQLVWPVGQCGSFFIREFGNVNLYSFVSSFKTPKNLVLIDLTNGKKIGVTPERADEFLDLFSIVRLRFCK